MTYTQTEISLENQFKERLKEVTEEEFSIEDFERYKDTLIEWNEKINLISKNTISDIYERHFLDSAQLYPIIAKEAATNKASINIADMGAGAGFPGLILAILIKNSKKLKNKEIHMEPIESIKKKADFLNHMVKTLKLNVIVQNQRIESIKNKKYDIITARALKPINELFKYSSKISHKDTVLIFLKGEKVQEELTEAKKYWTFDERLIPSKTSDTGKIVVVKKLRKKK